MKSDKLQDAIGMVDPKLIKRARIDTKKNTKVSKIKWFVPLAAMLTVAIAFGVFFPFTEKSIQPQIDVNKPTVATENTKPTEQSDPYTVIQSQYKAEYPIMAPHDGVHEAWAEDRREQLAYCGAGKNLDGFLQSTISEFLSGDDTNKLYSPLNVYMALAITAEIADGDSRQQILDLLGAESIGSLRTQAHSIWNANYCDDGIVDSIIASSLWLSDNFKYNEKTIQNIVKNYYASTFSGEMGSSEYTEIYKNWLNEQTNGLLKDQIESKELSADTVLAIATTLYFKGQWYSKFSPSQTAEDEFYSVNGTQTCDFMNSTTLNGEYYWGENFSAVGEDIRDSGRMYFILPNEGISTEDLLTDEEALSFMTYNKETGYENWKNSKNLKINLSVPKFDVSSKLDLIEGLKKLGVTDCFSSSTADFTPLMSEKGVYITDVTHGVRVSIDEEGVTGAAYTEVLAGMGAHIPEDEIDFVVNRPFIFVITGADSLPLFVGVVNQV